MTMCKNVEQLALVLVNAFDLAVEDRVGIDDLSGGRLEPVRRRRPWPRAWRRGIVRGSRASSANGSSWRSCARSVTQSSPIVSVMSSRQVRVGLLQPAPRRDAVGLVVEAVREQLGEVAQHVGAQQVASGSRPRRWCCASRRPPGGPCGPCADRPLLDQAHALHARLVAGIAAAHIVEEAAVDLVDDLQMPGDEHLEELDRPALQRLGQQRVIGVGQGAQRDVPGLVPGRAAPDRAESASARRPHRAGCVSFIWMATRSGSADQSALPSCGSGRRCPAANSSP